MRRTVIWIMSLSLLRDRAALAMAFLLPGAVFIIFAVIFAGASGGDLRVKVAVHDALQSEASKALLRRVLSDKQLIRLPAPSGEAASDLVRIGEADAALVLPANARALDGPDGEGASPILVIADPSRAISATLLEGVVRRAYVITFPDVPMRTAARLIDTSIAGFTPEQRTRVNAGLDAMRDRSKTETPDLDPGRVVERRELGGGSDNPAIAYYAGAVAMLFLLFAAFEGAVSYLEERESGLLDRLATSPGGASAIIDGKFLFLTLKGIVQVGIIYTVAWAAFGVDVLSHVLPWLAATTAAAIAASGAGLAFVSLCRTKEQARTFGQMLVLVLSAIGGSMVPRYLMPPEFRFLGWATPNTWALEAYGAIFQRGDGWGPLATPLAVLLGVGLTGLLVARILASRRV